MSTHSSIYSVVIGLGKTGLSAVRYLLKQDKAVVVMDSRELPPGMSDIHKQFDAVEMILGGFDEAVLLAAEEIVLSPGVSLTEPELVAAAKAGVDIIGDVELFCRVAVAPIIAVTGSNGKSTVVTLLAAMGEASGQKVELGGNIGIPVLDLLDKPVPDVYVLELSSFQLETTHSLKALAATVLNVSEDHMDRYESLDAYRQAKLKIYAGCGVAVVNSDDALTAPDRAATNTMQFGLEQAANDSFYLNSAKQLMHNDEMLIATNELRIKGTHNYLNALSALAMGLTAQWPLTGMLAALKAFPGLEHRCQWVLEANDLAWYNDSKGTNVGAALAAIEGLGSEIAGKVVLIAGGVGKGADFSPLALAVSKYVQTVVLIGEDKELIRNALPRGVDIFDAASMEDAVAIAEQKSQVGDVVLLSPACASFDMYSGFEARGEDFVNCVKALGA